MICLHDAELVFITGGNCLVQGGNGIVIHIHIRHWSYFNSAIIVKGMGGIWND